MRGFREWYHTSKYGWTLDAWLLWTMSEVKFWSLETNPCHHHRLICAGSENEDQDQVTWLELPLASVVETALSSRHLQLHPHPYLNSVVILGLAFCFSLLTLRHHVHTFLYHWNPKLPRSPRTHWGDDTEANEDNQPWVHGAATLTVTTSWG